MYLMLYERTSVISIYLSWIPAVANKEIPGQSSQGQLPKRTQSTNRKPPNNQKEYKIGRNPAEGSSQHFSVLDDWVIPVYISCTMPDCQFSELQTIYLSCAWLQ